MFNFPTPYIFHSDFSKEKVFYFFGFSLVRKKYFYKLRVINEILN